MNKAIFLDRDGVINNPRKNYYVFRKEDFEVNKGVFEALKYFASKDYLLIIITNQGGISKGKYTKEDVELLHAHMESVFAEHKIYFSSVYYCPHHSKRENCLCRKPKPLMLEKAIARFDISADDSWFIGDKRTDIEAGRQAGLKTIKIRKNQNLLKILKKIN